MACYKIHATEYPMFRNNVPGENSGDIMTRKFISNDALLETNKSGTS